MNLQHLVPEPDAKTAYLLNVSDIFSFLVDFPESRKKILSVVLPMIRTPPPAFLEEINCIIQRFSEPTLYLVHRILIPLENPNRLSLLSWIES